MSLRKRLRDQAATELNIIVGSLQEFAAKIGNSRGLNHLDVLRIAAGGRTDSIIAKVITDMANYKEAELEKIYNEQLVLELEEQKKGKEK